MKDLARTVFLFGCLVLAGCAVPPKGTGLKLEGNHIWRGRLAVRVDAPQPQSFSAGFELTGSSSAGEMTLFNPLGGTAAVLTWSDRNASLNTNGQIQHFKSLNELTTQAIGTEIPVVALFAWLAGDWVLAEGWRPDLSQQASGRILAKRLSPAPPVELRLMLDNE